MRRTNTYIAVQNIGIGLRLRRLFWNISALLSSARSTFCKAAMARPKSLTTPTSSKAHKRQASSTSTPATATAASRVSKRLKGSADNAPKNGNSTSKKSKYFDGTDSEDAASVDTPSDSGYEDEDASATEDSPPAESSEEEYNSEEESKPRKWRGRPAKVNSAQRTMSGSASENLWREGVKTGLGPGRAVFIAKPKPRPDGGIKYVPDQVHPNTMEFLKDLRKNNDREWLKSLSPSNLRSDCKLIASNSVHDPDFRQSWKDWESFVEALSEKISEEDETIPELPPKDLVRLVAGFDSRQV